MDIVTFEHLVDDSLGAGSLPGISAAMSLGGELRYLGGRGWANPNTRTPCTGSTVYPIASITKTMTAYLLLSQLAKHGIPPDTRIQELEPRFQLRHPTAGKTLTVEQLIHHFGPLPPHLYAWQFQDVDRETFLFERMPYLPCYPDPEPRYRYSNLLYALGGWLAGKLAGSDWETLFEESIRKPLRLDNTSFFDRTWTDRSGLAAPHRMNNGAYIPSGFSPGADTHIIAPASEVLSSVEDVHAWGCFALQNKLWEILSPPDVSTTGLSFSLCSGWRRYERSGHTTIWHSGQCSGYTSLLFMIPETSLVCACATNREGGLATLLSILKSVAGITDPTVNPSGLATPKPPPSPRLPPPQCSAPLQEGLYDSPGYGSLLIRKEADGSLGLILQNKISGKITRHEKRGYEWSPTASEKRFTLTVFSDPETQIALYLEPLVDPVTFTVVK